MKLIIIICLALLTTLSCLGQISHKSDTIFQSEDSTVVFFQTFCDSTLIRSFYGSWTGFISDSSYYRYGFLRLKKGLSITESLSHKWDEKTFPNNCGWRGPIGEPMIISLYRVKK